VTFDESAAGGRAGPVDIFELSDQYVVETAALDPMAATFWGIAGHDHRITDYSPEGWAGRLDLQHRTMRQLEQLAPRSRNDRIAIDVMHERVGAERDLIDSGEYHHWLCSMNSHYEFIHEIFDFMPRESDEDWANVRQRLEAVPDALDKLRASLLHAANEGKVAAQRQALASAGQCEMWGQPGGAFADLAGECDSIDLTTAASRAADAFLEFGGWLRADYWALASPRDPVGTERYQLFARYYTGAVLDLDDTYAWGWDQLHSIEVRIGELVGKILPGGTRDECIDRLNAAPGYVVEGADSFVAWNQDLIDRTIAELDGKYFEIAPQLRRCQAMAVPAGGPNTAYYTPPNEDFSRPGQIWHPVAGRTQFPLWNALTIVYHESTPGHHLQFGQMMCQAESLTRFQRLGGGIDGHCEGWALYAERLMHELGYFDDPVYELGWLVSQALRAARVILDIGLHCEMRIPGNERFHPGERWQPEMGLPFLIERTGYPSEYLASEVDRYLGMPGQAISYKVGERVWLEGRERAKRRLGAKFDLRQFHKVMLEMGTMGLDQLRAELDAFGSPMPDEIVSAASA
jgi:uncharacterized protein (DUF885 family)